MSRSRPLAPACLQRSKPPVVRPATASLRTLCKLFISRLARYLSTRQHARDLAEMPDRMRADIGLPPQPPEIRQRQVWPHTPDRRRVDWPGPHG